MTLREGRKQGDSGMTLKGRKKEQKLKISLFESLDDGIYYKRGTLEARRYLYPIFVGYSTIPKIGPEPLWTEFVKEGKKYKFVFYDSKLGMVAKVNVPKLHVKYIIAELLSKKGEVPPKGRLTPERTGTILNLNKDELDDAVATSVRIGDGWEMYK